MLRLGCDPKIFLTDAAGGFIASCDKIGGSKQFPRPLPLGDGFAVQEDNVAIEFNIPPAETKEEFINSINSARNFLQGMIGEMHLQFSQASAAIFPIMELLHPAAMEFGCDPDFDAWKAGAINPKPKADDMRLRSCGGHIHIGYEFKGQEEVIKFIKYMDLYTAVPSTLMDHGAKRKELYGKRGAFRFKPYGAEYRTLSNFWIFNDRTIEWAWTQTAAALDAWQQNKIDIDAEDMNILMAVNDNDKKVAEQLINKFNLLVV